MGYIYKITNKINQKVYIGKTLKNIQSRWKEHCRDYKKSRCETRPLYNAMNKYGIENFCIEELECCPDNIIDEREKFWIKQYNSYIGFVNSQGYNATLGGDGKAYISSNIKDIVMQLYKKYQNVKKVAEELHVCTDTVRQILHNNNIVIHKVFINNIQMLDLKTNEIIKTFQNQSEAARWLQEQGLTTSTDYKKISYIIGRAIKERKGLAYGYKWIKVI